MNSIFIEPTLATDKGGDAVLKVAVRINGEDVRKHPDDTGVLSELALMADESRLFSPLTCSCGVASCGDYPEVLVTFDGTAMFWKDWPDGQTYQFDRNAFRGTVIEAIKAAELMLLAWNGKVFVHQFDWDALPRWRDATKQVFQWKRVGPGRRLRK